MQRDLDKNISSHPSSEELAEFVDGELGKVRRTEVVKHLIECDACSDVVGLVVKYGKKKVKVPKPVNNSNYKGVGMLLSGLAMVSLVIFINMQNGATSSNPSFPFLNGSLKLGVIDLSKPLSIQYRGATDMKLVDKIIDADKILDSILAIIDLSHMESFKEAKEEETKGDLKMAKGLYSQAIIQATMTSDIKESLQQKIVIHSKLLELSLKDKNKEAIEEYKNILRYEIRLYSTELK